MRARCEPTPLALILAKKIQEHGPITFADYMEACLYHPEHGYYTKPGQVPRRDYFTSVDASPIFGRLLARQFHEMWTLLERPSLFVLAEAGAGAGALARQVLDFAAESLPEFYAALEFVAVERSAARRDMQSKALASHMTRGKFTLSRGLPGEILNGCIFSNELIDAFPVHRVVRERNELREIFVALGTDGLCEQTGGLSSPALGDYFAEERVALQDEQQAEVNLAACEWITGAAQKLRRGFLLTIDYGHEAAELYDERHMRGTLLAYERHRASEDFFRAPGEQDLTAHVNFTAFDRCGRRGGLERTGFTSQSNFLLALARHSGFADLQAGGMSEAEQTRARLLFKTLIHPEGMGETFQILIQHKGIEAPRLAGFEPL
jgi:SAM-dependent MidA family methyltransferase